MVLRKKVFLLALVSVLAFGTMGAGTEGTRFDKLGHQIMCTCGCNQILLDCNHVGCPSSEKMRQELLAGLVKGDSNDQVFNAFVEKYGPTVLAAPTTSGFNLLAWIMPFAVFLLGIGLVMVIVRNWKLRPATMPATPAGSASQLDAFRERARKETEL